MTLAERDAEHGRIARAVADGWTALGIPATKAGALSAVVMLAVLSARENRLTRAEMCHLIMTAVEPPPGILVEVESPKGAA